MQVRPARAGDAGPLAVRYRDNRDHLAPFEPVRDEELFTACGRLAGRITVTDVARGLFCSASLGYWIAADRTGRGLATHAVRTVLDDCFITHRLHRLEAGTLVDDLASPAVLRRTGFTIIDRAPDYLRIAGRWRDHLLFQRIAEDPATSPGT